MRVLRRSEMLRHGVPGIEEIELQFELAHHFVVNFIFISQVKDRGALKCGYLAREVFPALIVFRPGPEFRRRVTLDHIQTATLGVNQLIINRCELVGISLRGYVRGRRVRPRSSRGGRLAPQDYLR